MRREREEPFDPSQPALVVTYGNTTRKHRPLNRDLLVLGRSSCCDIGLVSPEVAPIHCVITRAADGTLRVRDCTGRSGTRLNGAAVHEEVLTDGDTLQIGTFSFQLNLPRAAPAAPTDADPAQPAPAVAPSQFVGDRLDVAKVHRLQKSRQRLARRAIEMRKQLREKDDSKALVVPVTPPVPESELGAKQAELEELEKKLQAREAELNEQDRAIRNEYRDIEKQRKELEKFAQESLAKKQAELERKVDSTLAERRQQLEAEAGRELEQRRAELERRGEDLRAREHELDEARRRLDAEADGHLADRTAALAAAEAELDRKRRDIAEQLREVERITAEVARTREALHLEFEDAAARLETEQELETRVREAEDHLAVLWRQCEEYRQRVEQQYGPIVAPAEPVRTSRELDIRSRELDCYARHLRRTHITLALYEQELADAYQQFHAEYDKAVREVESGKGRAGAAEPGGVAEAIVAELRREAEQFRSETTTKLVEERVRAEKAEGELTALRGELSALREELRERDEVLEHLKAELKQHQDKAQEKSLSDEFELAAPEQLLALVERLKREIADRDAHIREQNRRLDELQKLADPVEKESYEAELNGYRIELEQDRAHLNDELERLQAYKAELDEAKQETELQISQERVQLAREWAEINRLREQFRREQEEAQKPEGGRERQSKSKQAKNEVAEAPPVQQTPRPAPPTDLIARVAHGSKTTLFKEQN